MADNNLEQKTGALSSGFLPPFLQQAADGSTTGRHSDQRPRRRIGGDSVDVGVHTAAGGGVVTGHHARVADIAGLAAMPIPP